jgi:hypothetical protein
MWSCYAQLLLLQMWSCYAQLLLLQMWSCYAQLLIWLMNVLVLISCKFHDWAVPKEMCAPLITSHLFEQALTSSAPLERTTAAIDPYSLWVDGSRAGGFDTAAPSQQTAASVVSNPLPPVNQQQSELEFPTPQAPPGATRGRHRYQTVPFSLTMPVSTMGP